MSIGDNFDPDSETATGYDFVRKFANAMRSPPCTPAQFFKELEERKARATKKGVDLFTSGSDQPFVLDKYNQAFAELTHAEKFNFGRMTWGDDELSRFVETLTHCHELKESWHVARFLSFVF